VPLRTSSPAEGYESGRPKSGVHALREHIDVDGASRRCFEKQQTALGSGSSSE
jgi:hypothetical protein